MWPNPQYPADLVTFTEEILNGKLHFSCSECPIKRIQLGKQIVFAFGLYMGRFFWVLEFVCVPYLKVWSNSKLNFPLIVTTKIFWEPEFFVMEVDIAKTFNLCFFWSISTTYLMAWLQILKYLRTTPLSSPLFII